MFKQFKKEKKLQIFEKQGKNYCIKMSIREWYALDYVFAMEEKWVE